MNNDLQCYYCDVVFGMFEEYYVVRFATKPAGSAYRWKRIGKCCESCSVKRELNIDKFKTGEVK